MSGLIGAALFVLCLASCVAPRQPEATGARPMDGTAGQPPPRLPSAVVPAAYVTEAPPRGPAPAMPGRPAEPPPVPLPVVPGAEFVGNNDFCGTCHETYKEAFARGVHGGLACEKCHGAGSLHVQSRGLSPGTILSLKANRAATDAGRRLSPAERSELCLQCHGDCGDKPKWPGISAPRWRKSAHAYRGIACSDCHTVHYLVPPGTPPVDRTTSSEAPRGLEQARTQPARTEMRRDRPPPTEGNGGRLPGMERLPPVSSSEWPAPASSPEPLPPMQWPQPPVNAPELLPPMNLPQRLPPVNSSEWRPPVNAPELLPPMNLPQRLPPLTGWPAAGAGGVPQLTRLADYQALPGGGPGSCVPASAGLPVPPAPGPVSDQDRIGRLRSSNHLGAVSPGLCYRCHADKQRLEQVPHPHQMGVNFSVQCTACHATPPHGYPHEVPGHPTRFNCTTCHDPHTSVLPETKKDLCLKCHRGGHLREWPGSPHDRAGVACTDCHNPHPKQGLPMSVAQPAACNRCHTDKKELQTIAHPHQVGGVTGMNCTTCHTPHGPLRAEAKTSLCLKCHNGTQTGEWHSSAHSLEGVACTDCHNPHPRSRVPRLVEISSTHVTRPTRLPMAVEQPGVCYKCHPKIAGRMNLPSRHPVREGKMLCSDCHDVHRRKKEGIKAETVNLLCYQCHAEKQGPFVYEHPPVTENCCICHDPHGTIEKNLMRQATSFLCLRCHTGHRRDPNRFPHWSSIDGNPAAQQAIYTDCTQCHFEIHGTDFPSRTRIGPILTDH